MMEEFTDAKFDLIAQLMINWSEQWQTHILKHGAPLDENEMQLAKCVGVAAPDKVRILEVPNVPMPHQRLLHSALIKTDIFSLDAHGLTLEYGVFLKTGALPLNYWLAHELVHVGQYERMGGLAICLRQYLRECLTVGYEASSLEQEAHRTALKCLAQRGITFDFGN
ncbi:MAG: hypothetical protein ABI954_08785 [Pyrinomonadaceae bacterium]